MRACRSSKSHHRFPLHPHLQSLNVLTAAPSKEALTTFLQACFRHRKDLSQLGVEARAAEMGVGAAELEAAAATLVSVMSGALYASADAPSAADVASVLPPDTDARLKTFISATIVAKLPLWREASVRQRVSLPPLVAVDWRVDLKSSSSALSRMAVPTVLVNLTSRKQADRVGVFPGEETVSIELSRGGWARA